MPAATCLIMFGSPWRTNRLSLARVMKRMALAITGFGMLAASDFAVSSRRRVASPLRFVVEHGAQGHRQHEHEHEEGDRARDGDARGDRAAGLVDRRQPDGERAHGDRGVRGDREIE